MAVLDHPHVETVGIAMLAILRCVGRQPFAPRFYLAGGTALALQMGHRTSVDLDFFSEQDELRDESRAEIVSAMASLNPSVITDHVGSLLFSVQGISTGFFGYGYPLVGQGVEFEGVMLASPIDIGMMKLDALISRASRKDFYDLYFIAQSNPIDSLLELGRAKYPFARDFELQAVESLTFFENADADFQPSLLIPVEWETVKTFFVEQAKLLRQKWYGF
ncbi:MAG TPA: nucleotidyl transferase AbiEii/AbiGii toxin family protein [Anaerolineae bacterium]